jgi:uncharacterized protein (DUF1697 family)
LTTANVRERRSDRRPAGGVFVALLRGINVGRAKRVPMKDLAEILRGLGFEDVRTFLNSGNVVFRSQTGAAKTAAPRIERALLDQLGVASNVMVFSAAAMTAAVGSMPFDMTGRSPSRMLVGFFRTIADARRIDSLLAASWAPEAIAVGPRAVYMWCPHSIRESRVFAAVMKAGGDAITTRNWTTATKLARLASGI